MGFSVTGVNSTDDRDFVAHVTIAKMSKVKGHQRKKGCSPKKIAEVCPSRAVALHQQSDNCTVGWCSGKNFPVLMCTDAWPHKPILSSSQAFGLLCWPVGRDFTECTISSCIARLCVIGNVTNY